MSTALTDVVTLTVVIPAFNEAERIATTLRAVADYLARQPWSFEIRVVDDGSSDGTAAIVAEAGSRMSEVVLQREPHRGKGGAVRAGMLASRGAYRFLCDADLSMPVEELSRFLPPVLRDVDVAIGSREGQGSRRVGEPILRHIMGRAFNGAVQRLMLRGIEDTQCGFKMFTARAAQSIFPRVTIEGWAFDIEVLYISRLLGLCVVEVPIEWHYRAESQVSMVRDSVGMLRELLRVRAKARRGEYTRETPPL
jgi:dolichyl-phosphate beta-glucosyltransferase